MSAAPNGWRSWSAENVKAMVANAAQAGVDEALEALMEDSGDEVPVDTEALWFSRGYDSEQEGTLTQGNVFYETRPTTDKEYAVRQHEDLTLKHKPGQKAKYLEDPLTNNADKYLDMMVDRVKGVFQ